MSNYEVWSHPRLAAQVLHPRRDGHAEVAVRVATLQGARQILRLEQVLHALPGVRRIAVEATSRRVRVVWERDRLSLPALLQAFATAHHHAQPLRCDSGDDVRTRQANDLLKRLLVAGMFAMQVMSYALVIYLGVVDFVDFTTRGLFRWLSFVSTVPVVLYSAHPFLLGALRECRARRIGIHVPVALAVWLVFLASTYNTLQGRGEIYFDSVSMFVFLLLAGRYVELKARHRSVALGDAAIDGAPMLAERRRADGVLETVPAIELLPGDRVHVAEGTAVPADGVLESDEVQLDESLLSGESLAVTRRCGEQVLAGTIPISGAITLRVEHGGDDTRVARLGTLSTRARQARDAAGLSDDTALQGFVGRILLLTVLTGAVWWAIDPSRAFGAAVAVLVIACPCSYALTAPGAITRALGALAKHGVLVTDGAALTRLSQVDVALFDKTGTLTEPEVSLDDAQGYREQPPSQWLPLAAALARESSHPVARALSRATRDWPAPALRHVRAHAGQGIAARAGMQSLRLGHADFTGATSPGELWLSDGDGPIAAFRVHERPRANASAALAYLREHGIAVAMASGDSAVRAAAVASRLSIDEWHAPCTPEGKLALLQHWRTQGRVTLAVGDGSNDAPALAGADVSMVLASGTELAQSQADVLLLHGHLQGVALAHGVARQVTHVIARGRRWSLRYNLCAVPFAALGWIPPWLAAIGMSLSSLVVVLYTWRIGREQPTMRA